MLQAGRFFILFFSATSAATGGPIFRGIFRPRSSATGGAIFGAIFRPAPSATGGAIFQGIFFVRKISTKFSPSWTLGWRPPDDLSTLPALDYDVCRRFRGITGIHRAWKGGHRGGRVLEILKFL